MPTGPRKHLVAHCRRHLALILLALAAFTSPLLARQAPAPLQGPPADTRIPADTRTPAGTGVPGLAALVEEVSREVEALRGWRFKEPVKTVRVSLADATAFVEQQFDLALPPSLLALRVAVMKLSGLIPPDTDYRDATLHLLASQLVGYYDAESKQLSLVERAERLPVLVERAILAHELAHALDDQHISLLAVLGAPDVTSDARLVRSALIEGSASALTNHYFAMATRTGLIDSAAMAEWAKAEMERASALASAPRGLNEVFASYICGAAFLTKRDLAALGAMPDNREIGAALLQAVRNPPRSMEQVLHPAKYWDPAQVDEPVIIDDGTVERWLAASGWSVTYRDTLGELLTAVLTEPRDFPKDLGKLMSATAWTNPGAIGWGGDRFFLVEPSTVNRGNPAPGSPGRRGVWITAWDSPREMQFIRALGLGYAPAGYTVERIGGRSAAVFFGLSAAERRPLVTQLEALRASFSRGAKPWEP